MLKRIALILVLALATAGLFAGGEQEEEHRYLEVTRWFGPQEHVRAIEIAWAEEFPDSTLQISLGTPITDYMNARLAQDNLPDVWYSSAYENLWTYARRGIIKDLSNEPFVDLLLPTTPMKGVTYEGKIYGYPALQGYMGCFYNKEIFAQAGIAEERKTISDLKSMIGKIEALGVRPYGSVYKDIWPMEQGFQQMLANAVNEDGFWEWVNAMNEGSGTHGVPKFKGLMEVWDLIKEHGTPNAMDADYAKQMAMMAEGTAAMYLSNDSSIGDILKINPDAKIGAMGEPISEDINDSRVGLDIQITHVVAKDTKNWDLVQRFFDWITNPKYWKNGKINYHSYFADRWAVLPFVPYDGPVNPLGGAVEDLSHYRDQGWVTPWMLWQAPTGYNVNFNSSLEAYYLGKIDVDEFIRQLDENWHDLAAKARKAKEAAQ